MYIVLLTEYIFTSYSIEAYRKLEAETGKPQPWIKSASFITAAEAIANAEMGCQGVSHLPTPTYGSLETQANCQSQLRPHHLLTFSKNFAKHLPTLRTSPFTSPTLTSTLKPTKELHLQNSQSFPKLILSLLPIGMVN